MNPQSTRNRDPGQVQAPPPEMYLGPQEDFPSSMKGLELIAIQVLHSRICRQLDREYLSPEGPHPVTLNRHQELTDELDAR